MFAVVLKSHNGTVHKTWLTEKALTVDELKEIEEMAGYFNQEIVYMEVEDKDKNLSATEIMLAITEINGTTQDKKLD